MALQQAEEERLRTECPFRPDVSKPRIFGYYSEYSPPQPTVQSAKLSIAVAAASGAGLEGLSNRIIEHQTQREARAAAARAEREAAELAECSFSPSINRRPSSAGELGRQQHAVVVPGLERFMELKALAERQRREAEERAAKVFHQNPAGGALAEGRLATVPRPFKLEGQAALDARAMQRQAAALQAAAAERLEQCPFKPRTNVQTRQKALNRILADEQLLLVDL